MATIKRNTIKANTIKANTVTSSSPRPEPAQSQPQAPVESRSRPKTREERVTGRSSVQSLSKTAPVAPPVPKQTPPNLANLAHNPGAITSQKRIEAQQNFKPVEDIITAQIVGNDFSTGETKVKDGSGNIYSVQIGTQAFVPQVSRRNAQAPGVVVGQSVIISRARSQQGEVNVRLLSIVPLRQSPQDALAAFSNQGNINDLCKPSGSNTSTQNPPDRPEDPETPEVPPPPIEPSPNQPEPEEDPPSKPFGCNPEDSAQWYNGEGCPAGMNSLGFAQLSDGSIKTLCEGSNPPPGDGCPESPDEYGYICVSGECQYVPFGLYATKEECEGNCSNEPVEEPEVPLSGFSCLDGNCFGDSVNPQFETLDQCNAARTPIYGEPYVTGGQCPSPATYDVTVVYQTSSGQQTLFSAGRLGPIRLVTGTDPGCEASGAIFNGESVFDGNGNVIYNIGDCSSVKANPKVTTVRVDQPEDNCGDQQGPIIGYTC